MPVTGRWYQLRDFFYIEYRKEGGGCCHPFLGMRMLGVTCTEQIQDREDQSSLRFEGCLPDE